MRAPLKAVAFGDGSTSSGSPIAKHVYNSGVKDYTAEATVTDGDTIILNGTAYQLEGIDAPDTDQACLDATGAVWHCGIEVRDQLKTFVGSRDVRGEEQENGADDKFHRLIL